MSDNTNLKKTIIDRLNKTIDGQHFTDHNNAKDIELKVESPWMNITKNDFNSIRELARQGDAKTQKDLGDCYYKGEGTKGIMRLPLNVTFYLPNKAIFLRNFLWLCAISTAMVLNVTTNWPLSGLEQLPNKDTLVHRSY